MSVLRSVRDGDPVSSMEYLCSIVEFDLEAALENLSGMTALTPVRLEV